MAKRPGIFPTFLFPVLNAPRFYGKTKTGATWLPKPQHDRFAAHDYELLRHLGIAVAREGIPWPMVDKKGIYDFSQSIQ
jgi:hypothetical protein